MCAAPCDARQETDVPEELREEMASAREKLIELAAEGSDELMEKYLGQAKCVFYLHNCSKSMAVQ